MLRKTLCASSFAAIGVMVDSWVNCSEDWGSFWMSSQWNQFDINPESWKLSAGAWLGDEAEGGIQSAKHSLLSSLFARCDRDVDKGVSWKSLIVGNLENKGEQYTKRAANAIHQKHSEKSPLEEPLEDDDECFGAFEEDACSLNALHLRGRLSAESAVSVVHDNSETAQDIGSNQTAACAATWNQCNASALDASCCVMASEGRSDRTLWHLRCRTTRTYYFLCSALKQDKKADAMARDPQNEDDGDTGSTDEETSATTETLQTRRRRRRRRTSITTASHVATSSTIGGTSSTTAETLQTRRRRRRHDSTTTAPHVATASIDEETSPTTTGAPQTWRRRRQRTSTTSAFAIPASTSEETLQIRHLQRRRRTSTTVASTEKLQTRRRRRHDSTTEAPETSLSTEKRLQIRHLRRRRRTSTTVASAASMDSLEASLENIFDDGIATTTIQ